ncbi:UNKNOWN [Stylonychia lemnae]|uniref:Uncharacterized protein n=1 Tax=Stylonychia lemnae TaxID=5949 RepID=A0A078A3Z3_STYLE|nr:UNKNOWN [Stylonychia lemnae]|eukprot:CDW76862.1 UNKNOWN [Stylonychia lemnae]
MQNTISLSYITYQNFQNRVKEILTKAYNHKFKLVFFILLLYLIKKGYTFYKSVRPYLSLINEFRGGNQSKSNNQVGEQQQKSKTQSQLQLAMLEMNVPDFAQLMKLFQSTIKNIDRNLLAQPRYIEENLISPIYELEKIKLATQEQGQTSQQQKERFALLKNTLFKSLFCQLYVTRIVHLISYFQITMTGRFYRISEKKVRDLESNANDNVPKEQKGFLAILEEEEKAMDQSDSDFDPMSDQEQDKEKKKLTPQEQKEKAQQNLKDEQEACTLFVSKFFEEILKPLFINIFIPTIGEIVNSEIDSIDIRAKISSDQFMDILDTIHNKALDQIFSIDPKTAPDSTDLNNSRDSTDSLLNPRATSSYWIMDQILQQYNMNIDNISQQNKKLKKIADEFMDVLVSNQEYFEITLVELLDESYRLNLREFLELELNQNPSNIEQNPNALFTSANERTYMLHIVSSVYPLYQDSLYLNQLRTFTLMETQPRIEQIIKLIYFEDKAYFDIEIKDLLSTTEKQSKPFDMSELFKGLGGGEGGDNDILAKMLSSFAEE